MTVVGLWGQNIDPRYMHTNYDNCTFLEKITSKDFNLVKQKKMKTKVLNAYFRNSGWFKGIPLIHTPQKHMSALPPFPQYGDYKMLHLKLHVWFSFTQCKTEACI